MSIDTIVAEIDAEIARLQQARNLLDGLQSRTTSEPAKKPAKRRKLSAKARKAIADAQHKRWAKIKAEKASKLAPAKPEKKTAAPAKKKGMSAAARKRIAAVQKKRWAAIKAKKATPAKKAAKTAPAKKAAAKPRKAPATRVKMAAAPENAAVATTETAAS
jgi:hypothetical protein